VDGKLKELLQDAFDEAPAREANQAISRARRQRAGGDPDDEESAAFRAYEMVLTTFELFAQDLLPKLVYHLESLGAHLPACRGVVIAAFVGDRLYFVDAGALIARAARLLQVTPEDLVLRHGTGERRAAIPLALPGARKN
jgi:hypothetical protein